MDNYSEHRSKKNQLLKKWLPVGGLTLLTLSLMVYFKNYHVESFNVYDAGKSLLERVYTKNLRPLFFENELTDEDVFNFAMYNNLPVDKAKNKVLKFDSDAEGNEIFELQEIASKKDINNYEKFLKTFASDQEEKNAFDSILNKYKQEIYSSILVNENNSIAVDSRLPLIHQAMKADLTSMLKNTKLNDKLNFVTVPQTIGADFSKKITNSLNEPGRELIFLTPDTVFAKNVVYEKGNVIKALEEHNEMVVAARQKNNDIKIGLPPRKTTEIKLSESEKPILDYSINQDNIKVKFGMPELGFTKLELAEVKEEFEQAAASLKSLSMNISADSLNKLKVSFGLSGEDLSFDDSFNFEFNLQNIGEIISESIKASGDFNASDWEEFGLKIDSLANTWELDPQKNSEQTDKEIKEKKKKIRRKNR